MNLLITGDLCGVTASLLKQLALRHTIVAASEQLVPSQLPKGTVYFQVAPHSADFEAIFKSYQFGAALYFARPLFAETDPSADYHEFADCLALCDRHEVPSVLLFREKIAPSPDGIPCHDREAVYTACDDLCRFYRLRRKLSTVIWDTPLLYGYGETVSLPGTAVARAEAGEAVYLPGAADRQFGLLSQKDMSELLLRLVDSWPPDMERADIPPAELLTFGEFGNLLKGYFPSLRLVFRPTPILCATEFSGAAVKHEFDWVPLRQLYDELPVLRAAGAAEEAEKSGSLAARTVSFFTRHRVLLQGIELLLGFAAMELLNYLTRTTVQFNYIDFRLIYIVVLSTTHGIRVGLLASLISSISLLLSMMTHLNSWNAVIYNIEIWLPFVFYFLVGSVTGYIKDRYTNDNKILQSEREQLEKNYVLLNEFYTSAIQNKNKYKTQIMSYRNSFGRLFDVTRKLDSTVVDEIFSEALNALEDILDNRSVCIYRCFDQRFGRLVICSKEVGGITEKSLSLQKFPQMLAEFKDSEVWANRERLAGYPEYAMPIYQNDRLTAIILLQKASYEQLAVYYENLIKIVCGLFRISLIRALEYNDQIQDEMYLPGTQIMTTPYFENVLRAKEKMAKEGVSEYMLLRFSTAPENRTLIAEKIESVIRNTDVLGLGKDGQLCLLLAQANQDNVKFIRKRLEAAGIEFSAEHGEEGN